MSSIALFELLAALAAFAAAIFLADQQLHRPRPYKLLWTLGLFFYGVAAAAAFAGASQHWTVTEYKLWYYFGGILTAAFLGLGSFWLLGPRRVAAVITALATLLAVYAAIRILTYASQPPPPPTSPPAPPLTSPTSANSSVLPGDLTVVAILMNIPGALFLFGGAAWSAYQFWRRHAPGYRLASMLLLALGAVFPSVLTGLQRLGYSGGAALGEFVGAVCLFAGLLISLDAFTVFRVPFTNLVLRERRPAPAAKA